MKEATGHGRFHGDPGIHISYIRVSYVSTSGSKAVFQAVFSKNFYKNMLVLKVRIDLFFVVFGAVALEVLLYAVLISYICERFGMSKNEYTNKIYYS